MYRNVGNESRILHVSHICLGTSSVLTNTQILICVNMAKVAGFHRVLTENIVP